MRYALLLIFLTATASARGDSSDRRVSWSPDGAWFAYSIRSQPASLGRPPGWIFEAPGKPASNDPIARMTSPRASEQLWVTRADGELSHRVDEASDLILGPCWSPDGRSLAFGRRGADPAKLEIVIWSGPTRQRLVATRPWPESGEEIDGLAGESIAWSADGRYLAVPQGPALGLAILLAEDGRQVNVIPGGGLPAWSPTGSQLAFYLIGADVASLAVLDSALGRGKVLCEVGKATAPPLWTRDGLVTAIFGEKPEKIRFDRPLRPVDLVKIRLDGGQIDPIRTLSAEPGIPVGREIDALTFTMDRDGEDLFWSTSIGGRDNHLAWFRTREEVIRNRLVVLDPGLPLRSIALSPRGGVIAVRLGREEQMLPPALLFHDSPAQPLKAIVPDDAARASWISLLIDSARKSLASRPARIAEVPRPTILPLPGELGPVGDVPQRIRRVARMGRNLCDRPSELAEAPRPLATLLDEARLFFDVLLEDYAAARADLEDFEPETVSPDQRLALLGLRAQIALGLGEFERATRMMGYLRSIERKPTARLEWEGLRPVLSIEERSGPGWISTLEERTARLRDLAASRATGGPDAAAAGHDRFAIDPVQGFDPIQQGGRFALPEEPIMPLPRPRFPALPEGPSRLPRREEFRFFPPPAPLP